MTPSASVRVAAASFRLAPVQEFGTFTRNLQVHLRHAADAGVQLVVFPEYLTSPLTYLDARWEEWTHTYGVAMADLASHFQMHLLGTHLHRTATGGVVNRATLFAPGGGQVIQDKVHLTPWERQNGLTAGSGLTLIDCLGTRLAILVCYDVEFPQLAAAAAQGGAEMLLVPSWTDDEAGFWRVRHCAHARCVENQVYVVHAPLIGGIPTLLDFETATGAAAVLSPCDVGYPERGIVAQGGWDVEQIVIADLDLTLLRGLQVTGTVTPRRDARPAGDCQVAGLATVV